MFRFILNLVKYTFMAVLGAAVAAKFVLESNADPETEEIDLVSIFDGKQLRSTADPFYGGKITTMFGGVELDLRDAHPSPTGIDLDLAILFGGVSVVVPEGWRIRNDDAVSIFAGGFADSTRTTAEEDVPVINLRGLMAFGGLEVKARAGAEEEE